MTWSDAFTELDANLHDRISFECGKEELDDFIKTKASKHMKAGISRTMVLPTKSPLPSRKQQICSFYTIAPATVARDSLPAQQAKKLPHYPIPVFLIAQLAVHNDCHGQGLGKITLIKALERLADIYVEMAAYAVIVDCLDASAESFYQKYGFQELCQYNGKTRMFLPMKTVLRLFERQ